MADSRRIRRLARPGVLLTVVLLCALGLSAVPAQGFIYWTSGLGKARANLDHTGIVDPFLASPATSYAGLAVGGGHIYWTASGAIGRASVCGGDVNPSYIPLVGQPIDVAVDAQHVYWTNTGGTIGRANLDGTGLPDEGFIGGSGISAQALTVDANHIYWADPVAKAIGRADLAGSNKEPAFIPSLTDAPGRLAVDANYIYWAEQASGAHGIGRANLSGTPVPNESFITVPGVSPSSPNGIAVDAGHIYWAYNLATLGRASLDGTSPDESFITGPNGLAGVAVDGLDPASLNAICSSTGGGGSTPGGGGSPASVTPTPTHCKKHKKKHRSASASKKRKCRKKKHHR
jgi:hypothetical protein